jgi:hypothetical protein
MLKGQAKTDYQREYMRRRRAGQVAVKPLPKPKRTAPPKRMIDQIRYWGRHADSWRLHRVGRAIIDGLDLGTEQGMAEACRRYQDHLDRRRTAKESWAKKEAEAKTAPKRCSFCSSAPAAVGNGYGLFICEGCVDEAAAIIAAQRAAQS